MIFTKQLLQYWEICAWLREGRYISRAAASFSSKFLGALEGIIGSTTIIGADGTAIGTISSAVAAEVVQVVAVAAAHEWVEQPPSLFNAKDNEPQKNDKKPETQGSQKKPDKEGKSNKPSSGKPEDMTINQLFKGIRNLKKEIERHLKKLAEYIKAPDQCDNLGFLKDAGDNIVRRNQIIENRIRGLTDEIAGFRIEIIRIVAELTKRGIGCN
jgi:hypothetical protein